MAFPSRPQGLSEDAIRKTVGIEAGPTPQHKSVADETTHSCPQQGKARRYFITQQGILEAHEDADDVDESGKGDDDRNARDTWVM